MISRLLAGELSDRNNEDATRSKVQRVFAADFDHLQRLYERLTASLAKLGGSR